MFSFGVFFNCGSVLVVCSVYNIILYLTAVPMSNLLLCEVCKVLTGACLKANPRELNASGFFVENFRKKMLR